MTTDVRVFGIQCDKETAFKILEFGFGVTPLSVLSFKLKDTGLSPLMFGLEVEEFGVAFPAFNPLSSSLLLLINLFLIENSLVFCTELLFQNIQGLPKMECQSFLYPEESGSPEPFFPKTVTEGILIPIPDVGFESLHRQVKIARFRLLEFDDAIFEFWMEEPRLHETKTSETHSRGRTGFIEHHRMVIRSHSFQMSDEPRLISLILVNITPCAINPLLDVGFTLPSICPCETGTLKSQVDKLADVNHVLQGCRPTATEWPATVLVQTV